MRDPIEDLQHFRSEGATVNPLPASEVRRRGDRMRRRNTALATVGGVAAALAAVAVPLSVVSGAGDDGRDVSPAPPAPSVSWLQEVPEDFPLDEGLTGEVRSRSGARPLEQCAPDTWALGSAVARADVSVGDGVEGFAGRTLAVYADADAAGAALDRVEAAVSACAEELSGPLRYSVGPEDTGGTEAEALLVVEQAELEERSFSDLTFTRLSRDGNAVLIDQAFTSAGGAPALNQVSRNLLERSAVTRSALCVFDAQPCDLDTVLGEEPGSPAAHVVPDGFPLLSGWPTDSEGGKFGLAGPTRTGLDVMEPEACGAVAEVPEHTDLVRAAFTNPEDYRQRQLLTFATEDEADAYVDDVLAIFDDCIDLVVEDGSRRLTQVINDVSDTGDRAGGAITRYERDGEPVPGMSTLFVVRVGSAVLLAENQSEGSGGLDPAAATQEAFTAIVAESRGVVAAMGDLRAD
ncbi:hypothetical protein [Nocardioides deserti]|uniref:Sensor domain-containing protein n=1 Tax=Nocardioides deserti TaxID=1588644 RepID=A0ABR6U9K9_9ACTN|nr:hypothetical protein [Nocardioides deserti]MBC2961063.1 hypothetical protein [Nocardioides deserti]GGO76255.1 hypothetical protein GCM10012276_28570 [Nocardioides deserti]